MLSIPQKKGMPKRKVQLVPHWQHTKLQRTAQPTAPLQRSPSWPTLPLLQAVTTSTTMPRCTVAEEDELVENTNRCCSSVDKCMNDPRKKCAYQQTRCECHGRHVDRVVPAGQKLPKEQRLSCAWILTMNTMIILSFMHMVLHTV